MLTWILGVLLLLLTVECILDLKLSKGGLVKRACAHMLGSSYTNSGLRRAVCHFIPWTMLLLASYGWLRQFPTELLIEGAEKPYEDWAYVVGPTPDGVGILQEQRLRFMVALVEIEDGLRTTENFVQPYFVSLYGGMVWCWTHWLPLTLAILALELVLWPIMRPGPLRRVLRAFFNAYARPGVIESMILAHLLFFAIGTWYFAMAFAKEAENPTQMSMPLMSDVLAAFNKYAVRTPQIWLDIWATGLRFVGANGLVLLAIPTGVAMASFPRFDRLLDRFMLWGADKVNPFAISVLVFIVLGFGEQTRIMLAVLSVFPSVALDAAMRTKAVPPRMIERVRTYGATHTEVAFRRALIMIMPAVIDTIRLNIKVVIGILIVAECIGAVEGLGIRLWLTKRAPDTDFGILINIIFLAMLVVGDSLIRRLRDRIGPYYAKA